VIVHATTVVTNSLIERKGAPTAMLVTEGFRDLLTIRNEHRYDMYDPQIEFAPPLVARELTFGVKERTLADGTVTNPPDLSSIDLATKALRAQGVRSVAVCLLNSYANPANEQAVAAHLRQELPDIFISLSSDIAPQVREYPRASTTAINAYTMPVSQPYLQALRRRLADEGYANEPLIMLSSGGIIGAEIAGRHPVRMIESGPAAGALAASFFAEQLSLDRLMSFDMGGTTAKACLIEDGRPLVTGLFEADRKYRFKEGSGMPVTIPSIDMIEIGAGGGSIAHVDALGLLKVGPESAGADPGPACYGRGGTEPCVTDADLVLGLLDADSFLGGDMKLDRGAAISAMERLGARLGTSVDDTARGIYRIVAEAMASATRAHAPARGVAYRGPPLLAFGRAGPVPACEGGSLLQSRAVIFPPQASVLSAFWHLGHAGSTRPGSKRARPPRVSRLAACRPADRPHGSRRARRAQGGRRGCARHPDQFRRRPALLRAAERSEHHDGRRPSGRSRSRPHPDRVRTRLFRAVRLQSYPCGGGDRELATHRTRPRCGTPHIGQSGHQPRRAAQRAHCHTVGLGSRGTGL